MKRALEAFIVLGVIALQVALWPQITFRFLPEFVLVLAFSWGLATGVGSGFRLAFVSGLLLDLYSQQNFGMFTLAMVVSYATLLPFAKTPSSELSWPLTLSLFALAVSVYEVVILLVLNFTNASFPFFAELLQVATLNVVSSVVLFALVRPLVGRYASKDRTRRPSRTLRPL